MKNLSLLVSSFDDYSDLWPPFFELLFKNWEKVDVPIFLITNELKYDDTNTSNDNKIISLCLSKKNTWSKSVIEAISNIETKYILFSLEDFLLKELVNVSKIEDTIEFLIKNDAAAVYLNKNTFTHLNFVNNDKFKWIDPKTPYTVSTQAAIWNKAKLLELLEVHESAWDFEINATIRNQEYKNNFYCINDNIFNYKHHSVENGLWFPWDVRYLKQCGINVDLNKRKQISIFKLVKRFIFKPIGFFKLKLKTLLIK